MILRIDDWLQDKFTVAALWVMRHLQCSKRWLQLFTAVGVGGLVLHDAPLLSLVWFITGWFVFNQRADAGTVGTWDAIGYGLVGLFFRIFAVVTFAFHVSALAVLFCIFEYLRRVPTDPPPREEFSWSNQQNSTS